MFVPADKTEIEGTVVAGFVVIRRPDGSHAVTSSRHGLTSEGRATQLPSDATRLDIHSTISTAFDISNLP